MCVFLFLFRMAVERDLEKSEGLRLSDLIFDESGYFLIYATMLGVKIVNLYTNRCVRVLGKPENLRILKVALFQVNKHISEELVLTLSFLKLAIFVCISKLSRGCNFA